MLDGSVCRTRAVTGTNQTKIKRRITGCHHAQPEKGGELPGEWAPRADHRRLTLPELETAWAEDGWEHSWGARVNQKSAEKCRSGFQNQRKM